jgi:hypothetical protein
LQRQAHFFYAVINPDIRYRNPDTAPPRRCARAARSQHMGLSRRPTGSHAPSASRRFANRNSDRASRTQHSVRIRDGAGNSDVIHCIDPDLRQRTRKFTNMRPPDQDIRWALNANGASTAAPAPLQHLTAPRTRALMHGRESRSGTPPPPPQRRPHRPRAQLDYPLPRAPRRRSKDLHLLASRRSLRRRPCCVVRRATGAAPLSRATEPRR